MAIKIYFIDNQIFIKWHLYWHRLHIKLQYKMNIAEDRLMTIWEGCLKNDRKQQEQLYRLLAPRMLAVCMRYATDKDEAQDILQEGFIKMFKNMNNYRGDGSLEGWIRRIMVHCAISRYRKLKPMVLVEDFSAESSIP
jgi:DNA-directed RNA polymerase specialized sigma24 family protein